MTLTKQSKHPIDSVEYWRERAEEYKNLYETERESHDDFRQSSKELETELEGELLRAQDTAASLRTENRRLASELERLQALERRERAEFVENENRLQAELDKFKAQCADMTERIRRLEQVNDDLERSDRMKTQQVLDMTAKYEECLERCGMLEAGTIAALPLGDEDDSTLNSSSDGASNYVTAYAGDVTNGTKMLLDESYASVETPRRLVYHASTQTDEFFVKLQNGGADAAAETTYRRVPNGVGVPPLAVQQNGGGVSSATRSTILVQELLHKIEDFEKRLGSGRLAKVRRNGDRFAPRH